jgi:voltage-gated potassium channel
MRLHATDIVTRSLRGLRLALFLLVCVIAGGTVGYMVLEGWGALDSLYMTVTTITTVGYREVHPLGPRGQLFTVALILGGVSLGLYTLSLLAAGIIEGRLGQRFDERRRKRMIETLNDHFIVCGAGRIGGIIAEEFRRQGVPFVVVERDPERVHAVVAGGDLAVEADASREEVLKAVGIDRARGLIAAVGTDAENVYAVLTARVMRPDLFIIARADSDDAARKLLRAGANRVIQPYQIGAVQMAQTALRPAVVDFVHLATSSEHLELTIEQIRIGSGASIADRTLVDANLRQRFGVIVVGIQRGDGRMEFNPPPEAVMRDGDHIVVLGPSGNLKALEASAQ